MNIDYDDVHMQFKVSVTFTAHVTKTVHKHDDLQDVEENMINKIYEDPENYMDQVEVTDIERII